jgi:hypothetical protein
MASLPSHARRDPAGYQVVDVLVDRGYQPDAMEATAGVPIRLVFLREDDDPCSERVVFSSPRVDRRLAATGTTTVDLPAQAPGEVRFTCGMGRYRGRIHVVDGDGSSIWASLRRASRLDTPLGRALAPWICAVPMVAVLAAIVFGTTVALAAAGAVLIAWIVACLWVLRSSSPAT